MLNFEPVLGPHFESGWGWGGHDYKNLESALYEDAFIVILKIEAF